MSDSLGNPRFVGHDLNREFKSHRPDHLLTVFGAIVEAEYAVSDIYTSHSNSPQMQNLPLLLLAQAAIPLAQSTTPSQEVASGDIAGKMFIAALAAVFSLFSKVLYDEFTKRTAWKQLTIVPTKTSERSRWAIRVTNPSNLPLENCFAYLTILDSSKHTIPFNFCGYHNSEGRLAGIGQPVIKSGLDIVEDRLCWSRITGDGTNEAASDIHPGEAQSLEFVWSIAVTEAMRYTDSSEKTQYRLVGDCKAAVVFPSEKGWHLPRALLSPYPIKCTLKIVSKSLPAKEFEIQIDPQDYDNMVTLLRALPRKTASCVFGDI